MQESASSMRELPGGIDENLHKSVEPRVLALVVQAYKKMYEEKCYPLKEHEPWFSAILFGYMEELCQEYENITGHPWQVTREYFNDNKQILKGEKDPNAAPRIDIVIACWRLGHKRIRFPFESKKIMENDADLIRLYIKEGLIDRYLNSAKDYSTGRPWGGMIGYILQGSSNTIIEKLNKQIDRQRGITTEYLTLDKPIGDFEAIYKSRHQRSVETDILTITHLFLLFLSENTDEKP